MISLSDSGVVGSWVIKHICEKYKIWTHIIVDQYLTYIKYLCMVCRSNCMTDFRMNDPEELIFHGLNYVHEDEYSVPYIATYCEVESEILNEGTSNYKHHFVTFDDQKVNCDDCKEIDEFKESQQNADGNKRS